MLERSRVLKAAPTRFERRLWYRLRGYNRQGFNFRRQAPFRNYILDFVEYSCKLAIKLDGRQHGEAEAQQRDRARDALLASEGYLVLRLWNHELTEDFESVVERIGRAARDRRASERK